MLATLIIVGVNHRLRVFATAGLAAVGLLTLTGCDHFAADPIAFTTVDDVMVMRTCLPLTVSLIELKTYADDDDDDEGRTIWSAEGSTELKEGDELALGSAPAGMTIRTGSEDLRDVQSGLGAEFGVSIQATDDYGDHEFFAFVERDELSGTSWNDGYGPVATPCVREPCPPGYACLNQWPQPTGPALAPEPTWTPSR